MLATVVGGCVKNEKEDNTKKIIRSVNYQQVELKTTNNSYNYSGSLKAEVNSNLAFRVAGKIDRFLVTVGEKVEQGNTLAQLDQSDYLLQVNSIKQKVKQAETAVSRAHFKVDQVKAGITSIKAKLNQAKNNYQRIRILYQNDNVSKSAYDQARAEKEIAAAQLEQTKAQLKEAENGVEVAKSTVTAYQKQLELAQLKLKYTDLKAPISGVIVIKHRETGEVVDAGIPVLTIDSDQGLEVTVFVDEGVISRIKRGTKAVVSVDAIEDDTLKAEVTKIGRNQVGYQGNYPVTLKLLADSKKLKTGMTAVVKFQQLQEDQKIIVEPTAVAADQQGNFVYQLQKHQDYAKVQKRRVIVGELRAEGLEIVSGLEAGSLIVTKGVNTITNGEEVKLLN